MSNNEQEQSSVDQAVAEGGAYDVIRKRLDALQSSLHQEVAGLNAARIKAFGQSDLSVLARSRIRTENNCIARDILQIGNQLLFGYNVFVGLRKDIQVEDVFALYDIKKGGDPENPSFEIVPCSKSDTFLHNSNFLRDFHELYQYYSQSQLSLLTINKGFLLASFQTGERVDDIKVFRWALEGKETTPEYIDNRGERDIELPPAIDFEWQNTSREDFVDGEHAHVNILDKVFVETIGGDLTIKIENNTSDGLGIYNEKVVDENQTLDDAEYLYAEVGNLILLKIRPYQEKEFRYFVFNPLVEQVIRIDHIGSSCVRLPEDHGIIFPGGIYLETGEHKIFDQDINGLKYKKTIRSPNGEDVLYIFYEPIEGTKALYSYNLINKQIVNPIIGHGYALFDTGKLAIFSAEKEPTRNHPLQFWKTPYISDEQAEKTPVNDSFYGKIGNSALVRGISDLYSICGFLQEKDVSSKLYDSLLRSTQKLFDDHYWLSDPETKNIATQIQDIQKNAEQIIDEYEKVQSIQLESNSALKDAESKKDQLIGRIRSIQFETVEDFVSTLHEIRQQRGHIITLKSYRYMNLDALDEFNQSLEDAYTNLSEKTLVFLQKPESLAPYHDKYHHFSEQIDKTTAIVDLEPIQTAIQETVTQLDLISELVATLEVSDARVRTQIIDMISEIYGKLNQCKARADKKNKSLGASEATESFSAQFKLFSQSIIQALNMADTPEACDEQLSRLLLQIETLESQFSSFDEFIADIVTQREQLYQTFESHKQQLLDERERRCQSLFNAAKRVLSSVERRSLKFQDADELNAYFVADPMVMKIHQLSEELRELDNPILSDEIDAQFKTAKDQALRSLRDKSDIYEDGGQVIKMGPTHKFSVNTSPVDLTLLTRDKTLSLHITGTNFFQPIHDEKLAALSKYWDWHLESESINVYRGEYLAYLIFQSAREHRDGLSLDMLRTALLKEDEINKIVSQFAVPRYKEGYQKGIHDHDGAKILEQLIRIFDQGDCLIYTPTSRSLAQWFWHHMNHQGASGVKGPSALYTTWQLRAKSSNHLIHELDNNKAQLDLEAEIKIAINDFCDTKALTCSDSDIASAASYLFQELIRDQFAFILSEPAQKMKAELKRRLGDAAWKAFEKTINEEILPTKVKIDFISAWLVAVLEKASLTEWADFIPEAAAYLGLEGKLSYRPTQATLKLVCTGLLGDHNRIKSGEIQGTIDDFLSRMSTHTLVDLPAYRSFQEIKADISAASKKSLKLESFKAQPLSSFVRNRLINEVYLPIIGDNLAKQMGTIGENRRTDLMGLLMMISPPGYGKTTLMEYVANRLGLIFMKINCPSLGHQVTSLDSAQAPNSTAKQELEKLNLALEMGNNVMLYLDDIQHTDPEFLQKFISLCDGTRKIEGVWQGETKTYDLRGKKFCVVMAGNPYTESGETFQIPDMLANRADIYNLGDILGGMDEVFALSYIENCLTSNAILAPLATRRLDDVYLLVRIAKGEKISASELSHPYSAAEINEITEVLQRLFKVQDIVLKVNQAYIASAAQDDQYRTEPPFKLQGSYRNMNKMAEKISAVMNEDELALMIDDHYRGEAQLLTTGAQANLLKLAEIRGMLSEEDQHRWTYIKEEFKRNQSIGGDGEIGEKIIMQMHDMVKSINAIGDQVEHQQTQAMASKSVDRKRLLKEILFVTNKVVNEHLAPELTNITDAIKQSSEHNSQTKLEIESLIKSIENLFKHLASTQNNIEVINQPVPGIDRILKALADTMEHSIFPLVRSMEKKLDIDLRTHDKIQSVLDQLKD